MALFPVTMSDPQLPQTTRFAITPSLTDYEDKCIISIVTEITVTANLMQKDN